MKPMYKKMMKLALMSMVTGGLMLTGPLGFAAPEKP